MRWVRETAGPPPTARPAGVHAPAPRPRSAANGTKAAGLGSAEPGDGRLTRAGAVGRAAALRGAAEVAGPLAGDAAGIAVLHEVSARPTMSADAKRDRLTLTHPGCCPTMKGR